VARREEDRSRMEYVTEIALLSLFTDRAELLSPGDDGLL
jgi:hypothetical protein